MSSRFRYKSSRTCSNCRQSPSQQSRHSTSIRPHMRCTLSPGTSCLMERRPADSLLSVASHSSRLQIRDILFRNITENFICRVIFMNGKRDTFASNFNLIIRIVIENSASICRCVTENSLPLSGSVTPLVTFCAENWIRFY